MIEIKLKPCPFCGGEATLCKIKDADLWIVKCWNRGCEMRPRTDEKESKEEAIAIWNTRKPMERIIERLEDKLDKTYLQTHLYKHFVEGEQYALDEAIGIVKEEGGIE